jgi:hypothetical protein
MTNATVAETVTRVDGANIVLSYPGGEQKVTITPMPTSSWRRRPQVSDLAAGAQVAMTASRQAGWEPTARAASRLPRRVRSCRSDG